MLFVDHAVSPITCYRPALVLRCTSTSLWVTWRNWRKSQCSSNAKKSLTHSESLTRKTRANSSQIRITIKRWGKRKSVSLMRKLEILLKTNIPMTIIVRVLSEANNSSASLMFTEKVSTSPITNIESAIKARKPHCQVWDKSTFKICPRLLSLQLVCRIYLSYEICNHFPTIFFNAVRFSLITEYNGYALFQYQYITYHLLSYRWALVWHQKLPLIILWCWKNWLTDFW